jgi:hypothetical protein
LLGHPACFIPHRNRQDACSTGIILLEFLGL